MNDAAFVEARIGADGIYVAGGYALEDGQMVVEDRNGLEREVVRALALRRARLSGRDLCFLREWCALDREFLARTLGVASEQVEIWESGSATAPVGHSMTLRAACLGTEGLRWAGGEAGVAALAERIGDLAEDAGAVFVFEYGRRTGWRLRKGRRATDAA